MCRGGIYDHIYQIAKCLRDTSSLERLGFERMCTHTKVKLNDEVAIMMEVHNEHAEHLGLLVLSLMGFRLERTVVIARGWPMRSVLFLNQATRGPALAEFKGLVELHNKLVAASADSAAAKRLLKRAPLELMPAQQLLKMLQQSDFVPTDSIIDFCRSRSRRLLGTQLIEDAFNRCKNLASNATNADTTGPRLWEHLIQGDVASEVHKYDQLRDSADVCPRSQGLSLSAFAALERDGWTALRSVHGFNATPEWYHPAGHSFWEGLGDAHIVRFCEGYGMLGHLRDMWQSVFLEPKNVLIKDLSGRQGGGQWLFLVGSLSSEVKLVWPADIGEFKGGTPSRYALPKVSGVDPDMMLLTCFEIDDFQAWPYSWSSPLEQVLKCPKSPLVVPGKVHVRAMLSGEPKPLLEVAAEAAIWSIPKGALERLARKMDMEVASDLFSLLWSLVQGILKGSDESTAAILKQRTIKPRQQKTLDLVKDFEDVLDVLDDDDKKDMERLQEQSARAKAASKEFKARLIERAKSIRKSSTSGASKGKRSKKPASPWGDRAYPAAIPPGALTQAEAKAMAPPSSFIWRGLLGQGSWQGHLKPHSRVSASWHKYGHRGACLHVLASLWTDFLSDHNMGPESCPIPGLLDEAAE